MIGQGVGAVLPVDFGIPEEIGKNLGKKLDKAEAGNEQDKAAEAEREKMERERDYEQYNRLRERDPEKYRELKGGRSSGSAAE
jgi:hypothetical protein